jgi:hypothetical protein
MMLSFYLQLCCIIVLDASSSFGLNRRDREMNKDRAIRCAKTMVSDMKERGVAFRCIDSSSVSCRISIDPGSGVCQITASRGMPVWEPKDDTELTTLLAKWIEEGKSFESCK